MESILKQRDIFEVYSSMKNRPESVLEEFQRTNQQGETFFPLLIDSYTEMTGVVCYKMKLVDDIFAHPQLR